MNERDLEPEEPGPRLLVDQLHAVGPEPRELGGQIRDGKRDVVHPGAASREKAADRGVRAERVEELDPRVADSERRRLDPLLRHDRAMLDRRAEETGVRLDGAVEVVDRDAEVMDP